MAEATSAPTRDRPPASTGSDVDNSRSRTEPDDMAGESDAPALAQGHGVTVRESGPGNEVHEIVEMSRLKSRSNFVRATHANHPMRWRADINSTRSRQLC